MKIYDARIPEDQPQTHALVVGVNHYDHLPKGGSTVTRFPFGLTQLTSAVPSAIQMAEWILRSGHRLNPPLGTLTVLLSPANLHVDNNEAASLLNISPGTRLSVNPATFLNIKKAFEDQLLKCGNKNTGNATWFYFCGHGLEAADRFLVPQDYGVDSIHPLDNLINITETRINMTACKAGTQVYFLDACRQTDKELKDAGNVGQNLVGYLGRMRDAPLDSALYHGTVKDRLASTINGIGVFTQTLLRCLDGQGAWQHFPTAGQWSVDTDSLGRALRALMGRQGQPFKPDVPISDTPPDPMILHYVPDPVPVLMSISCASAITEKQAQLWLTDRTGAAQQREQTWPFPWEPMITSGSCTVGAEFADGRKESYPLDARPPVCPFKVP